MGTGVNMANGFNLDSGHRNILLRAIYRKKVICYPSQECVIRRDQSPPTPACVSLTILWMPFSPLLPLLYPTRHGCSNASTICSYDAPHPVHVSCLEVRMTEIMSRCYGHMSRSRYVNL